MPHYRVTDTRQVQTLTQAGTMREVYRVWIVTEKGSSGSVDVAPSEWNETRLPEVLENLAVKLDLAFEVASGG